MERTQNKNQLIYGILSIACPLLMVTGTLVYQSISRSQVVPGSDDHLSLTLMDVSDGLQLFQSILFGCFAGLILAILSLITKTTKLSGKIVGYCGLAINGLPLLLILWSSFKEGLR